MPVWLKTPLRWLFNLVAVPVLLFEAWGLKPLLKAFELLRRWRVWAWLENKVAGLPPYGALALFVLPSLFLIPVKIAALYFLAAGQKLWGIGILVLAKVIGTVIVARIFSLTRPQLMRIVWFAHAWGAFERWRDRMLARLRESSAWQACKRFARGVRVRARRLGQRVRRWFGGGKRAAGNDAAGIAQESSPPRDRGPEA